MCKYRQVGTAKGWTKANLRGSRMRQQMRQLADTQAWMVNSWHISEFSVTCIPFDVAGTLHTSTANASLPRDCCRGVVKM